jgi:TRAP-type C4-dicarboxylate transport system substrate-binding protein
VLTNGTFWNTLTETEQEAFDKVTQEVARLERGWTTEDAANFEKNAKDNGCDIVELSAEDKAIMQSKAETVYKIWESRYMPGLVKGIQKLQ